MKYWERQEGPPEDQENESKFAAVRVGGQREPVESFSDLGCEMLLGFIGVDLN